MSLRTAELLSEEYTYLLIVSIRIGFQSPKEPYAQPAFRQSLHPAA